MNSKEEQPALAAIMPKLNRAQLRHIAEMLTGLNRAEAAKKDGLEPEAVYSWPPLVMQTLELVRQEPEEAARQVFRLALLKAVLVKVAALDSDNESNRQKAASEIIEGMLGRSFQRSESTREELLAEFAAEAEEFSRILAHRLLSGQQ